MLKTIEKQDLNQLFIIRQGEEKLGQTVETLSVLDDLQSSSAQFVLLGICEDIGIRANFGFAGANEAWNYFLAAFLNVQHNSFLSGEKFAIAGTLEFNDLMQEVKGLNPHNKEDLKKLRELTSEVDKVVFHVVENIVAAGKIPIIIGGGHNNAFGNIAGLSKALNEPVNVLNIDPHADYRAMEGRHSGNGFRYAKHKGFLTKYAVFGLHESYNNQEILDLFHQSSELYYLSFDELFTFSSKERDKLFKDVLHWLGNDKHLGLEVDLDSVTNFPVSAMNPCGFTIRQLRLMISTTAALATPKYLHLSEACPARAQNQLEKEMLGKSLAYLVCDFVKAYPSS